MKGSINVDFAINLFHQAISIARLDHTCWKTICEAIEARLER
jgi:hypothetical protein